MASDERPLGRLIRAASQANTDEALHATSRVSCMRKCQVSMAEPCGRLAGSAISDGARIATVASLVLALARRATWAGVSTSAGLTSSPDPATIMSDGTVTA